MKKLHLVIALCLLTVLFAGSPARALDEINAQAIPLNITFETVVSGLAEPVFVTHAGDGSGRLFILLKNGEILIYKNGSLNAQPFLDLSADIVSGGEQGLLGLAFAPDYPTSGYFYVYYNNLDGDIEISRFTVSGDADIANAGSKLLIMKISRPGTATNHNGGMIAFSPNDGYLYAFTGDGGGGGDPDENGQNTSSLLGKILRIDPSTDGFPADNEKYYSIPAGNPFAASAGADEIWAYGLRNPWRASFDRDNGDLYIGDVGQGQREEVNYQAAASTGGENYGWNVMEGSICYDPSSGCDTSGKTMPVAEYTHADGCSVTGGYIYHGTEFTDLQGVYLYADFCEGTLYGLQNTGSGWNSQLIRDTNYLVSSFGEDENGEMYLVNYGGSILKIVEAPILSSTLTSQGKYDGYLVESSENSNLAGVVKSTSGILQAGDTKNDSQSLSILSFGTSGIPDNAVIVSAQVKAHYAGMAGQPFNQMGILTLDIKKGVVGNSAALRAGDFNASTSLRKAATLETITPPDDWFTFNLSGNALQYVNTQGITQFKLRFTKADNDDRAADWVKFHSGNFSTQSLRPVLIITYYVP